MKEIKYFLNKDRIISIFPLNDYSTEITYDLIIDSKPYKTVIFDPSEIVIRNVFSN